MPHKTAKIRKATIKNATWLIMLMLFLLIAKAEGLQYWSWGYSLEFDKREYANGSQGTVTLIFDVFPNAKVSNITITLYFIRSNGELAITILEYVGSTDVFDFYLKKAFNFTIATDTISSPINYIAQFAIRGPYDSRYTYKTTDLKQGMSEGYTVKIVNPSFPTYNELFDSYNNLDSSHISLQGSYEHLDKKYDALSSELNTTRQLSLIFVIATVILATMTIYFVAKRPKESK